MSALDDLRRRYAAMPDETFTYFATHEARGLSPEAIAVLRDELHRRGTVPDAAAAIDAQVKGLDSEQFERLLDRFRRQPCPECGRTEALLNAILLVRSRDRDIVVGCPPCLERALGGAATQAGLGALLKPAHSLSAALANEAQRPAIDQATPTDALRRHVWDNRGEWVHLLTTR